MIRKRCKVEAGANPDSDVMFTCVGCRERVYYGQRKLTSYALINERGYAAVVKGEYQLLFSKAKEPSEQSLFARQALKIGRLIICPFCDEYNVFLPEKQERARRDMRKRRELVSCPKCATASRHSPGS